MRHSAMVLALAVSLAAGVAYAAPTSSAGGKTMAGPRALYICGGSAETRRALMREHGAVEYISAERALEAQASGEAWSAPRCMKEAEFRRLKAIQGKARLARAGAP